MHRSKSIDILRALAVFLVLGRHMSPVASDGSSITTTSPFDLTTLWARGGWTGVDLFFVLSGFLVSGLLFREHQTFGALSGKDFLIRRGLKIYPAFWILIGVTVVQSVHADRVWHSATLTELLFLQNYGPALWNHTWSLAVEEHFYLLLLLFLVLLSRRTSPNPFRLVPFAFIVLAALSLGLRIATSYWAPYDNKTHLFPSHLRMDSLFCGVVISYYYHYHSARFLDLARRYRAPAILCGTLAFVPAFVFPLETSRFVSTIGLTLLYVGSGLVLIATLTFDRGKHKIVTAIAYVGSHSYSIYLWHMPVVAWLLPRAERLFGEHWTWSVSFGLYLVGSLSVGIIMAKLVEFPIVRLRDRWVPSRARPLTVSAKSNPSLREWPALPARART